MTRVSPTVPAISRFCSSGKCGLPQTTSPIGCACQQRNAVVGLLAGESDLVTRGLDLGLREIVILELGFLQAQGIGLLFGQPVEQVRQAHLQRIDVPAGDLHLARPPDGLLP